MKPALRNWTIGDADRLIYVAEHTCLSWAAIARRFPPYTGRSIRLRYVTFKEQRRAAKLHAENGQRVLRERIALAARLGVELKALAQDGPASFLQRQMLIEASSLFLERLQIGSRRAEAGRPGGF